MQCNIISEEAFTITATLTARLTESNEKKCYSLLENFFRIQYTHLTEKTYKGVKKK